jgi:hypothetical protein
LFSTSSRAGEEASRKTPFDWPFIAGFTARVTLLRTVTSAPATLVLIKPATLLMCELSMTTGAVVATVTAGVLLSVLRRERSKSTWPMELTAGTEAWCP